MADDRFEESIARKLDGLVSTAENHNQPRYSELIYKLSEALRATCLFQRQSQGSTL
jgi:hypothetical protein